MMKVIHIVGSLDISAGGPSRSVPQTCIELSKMGVQIDLICRPSEAPVNVPENENLKIHFKTLKELYKFGKSLDPKDYDLIHLQHVWDPYIHLMAKASRKKGIPYIITPRGMLEPWIMARNPLKKRLAMSIYQKRDLDGAKIIHATSDLEAENVRKLGFLNPLTVIPNGIDLSKVPSPKIDFSKRKIVYLSRIHPKKGIELLLDAWKILGDENWILEIAGDGEEDYVKSLLSKIHKNKIRNVFLVGPKYGISKWDFLKSGDLFILPTYSENFGIVVAEALAVGVPVITTKGTPWHELETENCGWWIELSIENLVKSIKSAIYLKPDLLMNMGKNGVKLIHNQYSIISISQRIFEVYESCLEKLKEL